MGNTEARGWWFVQVPIWLVCDQEISSRSKEVFAYLKWRQGTDAACWPSKATISYDLGISDDTTTRCLQELGKRGYVERHVRSGLTTLYQVIADPGGLQEAWEKREDERRAKRERQAEDPPAKMPPHDDTHGNDNQGRDSCIGADAPPQGTSPSPPPSKKPEKKPTPRAVKVFHANAHRFPHKAWYENVAEIVGEDEEDLEFWGRVVHAYVGLGWNPTNVKNMLNYYKRREIPRGRYERRARKTPDQHGTSGADLWLQQSKEAGLA